MKFWVGVTDSAWFRYLRHRAFDEVNFWNPGPTGTFAAVEPGAPFLFKLKRPYAHIGGFGTFVSHVRLPLSMAWRLFGERNGAATQAQFETLVRNINARIGERDPEIGCTLLSHPVFLDDDDMPREPPGWAGSIVRGKTYDDAHEEGRAILSCLPVSSTGAITGAAPAVEEPTRRYGAPFLASARLGQGTFRALVTEAYGRRCAMTGENIVPVLEAAHVKPFSEDGPSTLSNGLLLRSDFHKLFDLGYVTVTPQLRIEVSRSIREEWFNGKAYYRLHGERLSSVPKAEWARPAPSMLAWHNEHRFRG